MGDGRSCTQTLLSYGADAIMAVAGPQTMDTLAEIANQKSNCIVIGVDTPQELTTNNTNKTSVYTDTSGSDTANRIIKFSATKNISTITEQILSLAYGGAQLYQKNAAGELEQYKYPNDGPSTAGEALVGTYGYLTVGNYQNNGIRSSQGADGYLIDFVNFMFNQNISNDDGNGYDKVVDYLQTLTAPGSEEPLFGYLDQHMM
ncbi:hypothetical protein FACS1894166_07610 [Bacilli bacterium]|nr:hypothetical protein FACS1894166_07610 [Bacilli bacterium]